MKKSFLKAATVFGIACLLLIASLSTVFAEKQAIPAYENNLKIAVVNFQPVWGDKDANLKKMISDSQTAADNGAKLILFPEMALTGYAMEKNMEAGVLISGGRIPRLLDDHLRSLVDTKLVSQV